MRVTDAMTYTQVLTDIQGSRSRLAELQEQLASGHRINRPSDDPAGVQHALDLTHALAQNATYLQAAQAGEDRLNATDRALSDLSQVAMRVRQLLLNGANSDVPASARNAMVTELQTLKDQVVELANTEQGGTYLFGGTRDSSPPWSVDALGNLVYSGDTNGVYREIGPGVRVAVNVDASADITNLYSLLDQAITDMGAGDVAALGGADLQSVSDALTALLDRRAEAGALSARMQLAADRLTAAGVTLTQLKSEAIDVDLSKTVLDATQQQTSFELALRVGAELLQPTLLDFLR